MTVKEALGLFSCLVGVVEYVECVIILIFGINSVSCKAAAQTVGTVVHIGNGLYDITAVHAVAVTADEAGNGTSGRNPDFAFF